MKEVALLVFACDRYEFIYKGFDYFFNKYWDHSIAIEKYFSTENKSLELQGYKHLKSGEGEWTNRLKRVLDQIPEKYIIFFQEDMWLSKSPLAGNLEKIIKYAVEHNLKLLKLHSSEVYKTDSSGMEFDGLILSKLNKIESDFLMSHQVSLWDKQFLYDQLKDNEHPWRNERKGSKRLQKTSAEIFQIDYLSENGKAAINMNNEGSKRGEYYTISVNACINEFAIPFIEEIKPDHPEYAKALLDHHENQITHDGKKKPRKEDPLKKLLKKLGLK